ncbi:hypothetical protein [Methanobacterium oryzae]|uniref:hypothetical protein n=1 Tax=Methanobacterium oryzae TaxID=69540 RepID=UPI003D234B89
MDQKGQASVDLIFATLILIILASSVVNGVSNNIDVAQNAEIAKAKVLSDSMARSINSVYSSGEGQCLVVDLPGDFNYTLTVSNSNSSSLVSVFYKDKTIISYIIPNGSNIQQTNMYPNETYNITNNNGIITFTKLS